MTGEAQFKDFADANYGAILPPWGASMWEVDALESLLSRGRRALQMILARDGVHD